jgi:hypothetical protein
VPADLDVYLVRDNPTEARACGSLDRYPFTAPPNVKAPLSRRLSMR